MALAGPSPPPVWATKSGQVSRVLDSRRKIDSQMKYKFMDSMIRRLSMMQWLQINSTSKATRVTGCDVDYIRVKKGLPRVSIRRMGHRRMRRIDALLSLVEPRCSAIDLCLPSPSLLKPGSAIIATLRWPSASELLLAPHRLSRQQSSHLRRPQWRSSPSPLKALLEIPFIRRTRGVRRPVHGHASRQRMCRQALTRFVRHLTTH